MILNTENWRDISGYEGLYQVSDLGRVKSLARIDLAGRKRPERMLRPGLISSGYLTVCLCRDHIKTSLLVHQLVAMAFLGHKPCRYKFVVDHRDRVRTHNYLSNLRIITNRVNTDQKHLPSFSAYTGVFWRKNKNRWSATIRIHGKAKHLGTFKNEYDAHLAYESAFAKQHKIESNAE